MGVLLGNGDGTFKTAVTYDSRESGAPVSVAVADVNGDGKPDLVATGGGTVGVLLGNGDGTFQSAITYISGGVYASSIKVADVNGDAKPDLLVANNCGSSNACTQTGTVGVLINMSIKPTTTALVSSVNPSQFAQAVTFTATVTSQGFEGTPTGTVNFLDGVASLGSSSLNFSAVATVSASTLTVGTHSITAAYSGDTNFAASTSPC